MDMENQAAIKRLAEENGADNLVVVLGATDIEGAEITAETVTLGDPSFAGPLGGVSLGLPVYHILEPEVKAAIPADVYEQQAGFMEMVADIEAIGKKFKEIREKA
ncbi:MAG: glycine/sarcosine/betaine reductase complex protein A [Nitrospira bacterium SG8_3]|nr:MAG: glycine/sarcosine/betaine reductase complex protein A [Nitrospira bacterium SG8_3]